MSLVGGLAGLCCWFLSALFTDFIQGAGTAPWVSNTVQTALMGALISGLTVGFADRWTGDKVLLRWVLIALGLGLAPGIVTGLSATQIQSALATQTSAAVPRVAVWVLAGGLIGLV